MRARPPLSLSFRPVPLRRVGAAGSGLDASLSAVLPERPGVRRMRAELTFGGAPTAHRIAADRAARVVDLRPRGPA